MGLLALVGCARRVAPVGELTGVDVLVGAHDADGVFLEGQGLQDELTALVLHAGGGHVVAGLEDLDLVDRALAELGALAGLVAQVVDLEPAVLVGDELHIARGHGHDGPLDGGPVAVEDGAGDGVVGGRMGHAGRGQQHRDQDALHGVVPVYSRRRLASSSLAIWVSAWPARSLRPLVEAWLR